MRIAGWIFLALGVVLLLLGILWIQVDRQIDVLNIGALSIGTEMVLIGYFLFFRGAEDSNLRPVKKEEK